MKTSEIVLVGVFAQMYSRLVMAAINGLHVYYSDLAPVVFGVQYTRLQKAQADVVWDLLRMTMKMDIQHERPPVAALFVSRATDTKRPGHAFFKEYEQLTGTKLTDEAWQELVKQVWAHYAAPDLSREPS